jgi:hypothetical protein
VRRLIEELAGHSSAHATAADGELNPQGEDAQV